MSTDVASLELSVGANDVVRARDELGRFTKAAGEAEDKSKKLTGATSALAEAAKALAKAYAAWKVAEHIQQMSLLAARYETLGVVMRIVGNNAGYTGAQMLEFQKGLEKTGISMNQSRQTLVQMASATIDLTKATQLARVAQDLAVIGQINSSEALGRMTTAIQSGEIEILKTMGMNVQWETGYAKLATQLHKNVDRLTEHEKVMSRTNTVLGDGVKLQGVYEASMGTAGKAITSLTRYWEDLELKLGDTFLPVLTSSVFKLTEALKLANNELAKTGSASVIDSIGKGLVTAFDFLFTTISIRAHQFFTVLEQIGIRLGGFAAQAKLLMEGDFKGFAGVSKMVDTQLAASVDSLVAFETRMTSAATVAGNATAAAIEKAAASAKKAEADRIAQGKIAREKAEADAKAQKAAEEAKAARQAILDADLAAIRSQLERDKNIRTEHLADVSELNRQGIASDTDLYVARQKATAQAALDQVRVYDAEIARLKKFQAKDLAERVANNAKIAELERDKIEAVRASGVARDQLQTQYIYDSNAATRAAKEAATAEIDAIMSQTASLREQNDMYGKLPEAITAVTIARLESRKTILEEREGEEWEIAATQRKIEGLRALQKEQTKATELSQWTNIWRSIDQAAHDTFINIFNGGKNAFDKLRDTLKSGLLELLYQMTVKKWIFNIGASISSEGGASAAAAAAQAAGGNNTLTSVASVVSAAQMAYKAITAGFDSIGTTVADGVQYMLTKSGLSDRVLSNGPVAQGAGQVAQSAGSVYAGHVLGNMVSGDYSIGNHGQAVVNVATVIGEIIAPGIGGAVAGVIGGLLNRAFGMGSTEVKSRSLTGSFGANGFSGNTNTSMHQDGGWFRSDKNWTESPPIDAAVAAEFTKAYDTIKAASKDFAETLGMDASNLATRTQALNVTITTDQEANKKAIADFFIGVGNDIANELVPQLSALTKEGESASAALQRIAGDYAFVDVALKAIGTSFGTVGIDSVVARERLIDLSGGLQAFGTQSAFFAQTFLSDSERLAPAIKSVNDQMAALGLSSVTTLEQFKDTVLGIANSGKLATEEGAKLYAQLMVIAPQFAQVADAQQASMDKRHELEVQLMEALGQKYQALAAKRSMELEAIRVLDPALAALQRQIYAAADAATSRDVAAAYQNAGRGITAALKTVGEALEGLRQRTLATAAGVRSAQDSIRDSYFSAKDAVTAAQEKVVGLQQKAAESMVTFSGTIKDFLATLNGNGGNGASVMSLKALLSSTSALAAAGDKKSQDSVIGIAEKLLKAAYDNAPDAVSYNRIEAQVKIQLAGVAKAVDALAATTAPGGVVTEDPLLVAQRELVQAQDRMLEYAGLAYTTGTSLDESSRRTADSTEALLAAYQAATAEDVAARREYLAAMVLTSNLALSNSSGTASSAMGSLMEALTTLSEAQATFIQARNDLAEYVINMEISQKNLDKFAQDLVASLGLTGEAATSLTGLLTAPGTAATTLATILGTGALNVSTESDNLAKALGLSKTDITTFAGAVKTAGVDLTSMKNPINDFTIFLKSITGTEGGLGAVISALKGQVEPATSASVAIRALWGEVNSAKDSVFGFGGNAKESALQVLELTTEAGDASDSLTSVTTTATATSGSLMTLNTNTTTVAGTLVTLSTNATTVAGVLTSVSTEATYLADVLKKGSVAGTMETFLSNIGLYNGAAITLKTSLGDTGLKGATDAVSASLGLFGGALDSWTSFMASVSVSTPTGGGTTGGGGTTPTPPVTSTPELSVSQSFIKDVYSTVLGRAPDAGGLTYWAKALDDGQITVANAAQNIALGATQVQSASAAGVTQALLDADKLAGTKWLHDRNLLGFATGAAFTNGIVSRPTVFNTAQMGEDGPEAIMPLANIGGKLGVRMAGSAPNGELLAEFKAMRAQISKLVREVEQLRTEQRAGDTANVVATKDQTRFLRDLTDDGVALFTTPAE